MAVRQRRQRRGPGGGRALLAALLLLLLCVWCRAAGERLRYAIPEELGRGSLVGPLARDLGLSADELPARKLQVASAGKKQLKYFTVNEENGNLYVNERLDREEMCGESATCSVSFEVLVHNPLNVFHVEVVIEDVNDNSPAFRKAALDVEIGEWTLPGSRFPLETARDADVGSNSQLTYQLSSNPSFSLALKESPDGSTQPELVLERALDREKQSSFDLVLMAVDGGDPARSGTVQVLINVTDANDNPPVFSKSLYEAGVSENLPAGSLVLQVQAMDADAGTNGQVSYSFGNVPDAISTLFAVDRETGEVRTAGALDFEEKSKYTFGVEARDGGGLVSHCKVQIDVIDENDNAPEIMILSLSSPVPEDAPVGTVVSVLNVNDPDSGENGEVSCSLSGEAPLSIVASSGGSYKVVTSGALDREQASEQRVTVVARDRGRPALWSSRELVLEVSDVNDNAPVFEEAAYSAYVAENNAAGALVLRVQARDADAGANGRVSYWLAGGSAGAAGAAPLVSVEARSGALYAQRSLDYEQCREFTVAVRAQDGGSPARSSTATVRVFVLDRNDNAPRVLWPAAAAAAAGEGPGGAAAAAPFEVVPRSAEAGYLVAKVVAVDADAGRNAWLSYELVQASEPALFRVGLHSGEVRTARAVGERDAAKQRLVAVVKDHGQPALSATATLHVVLAESLQEALPELSERPAGAEAAAAAAAELQFYLVLALALLSALLVLSVALAVLARLRRAGPPAVLRCLGAQRFSLAGAAFPADFCEGTLPYSYNLCVPPPARALPEAAWPPPPPVPMLSAEELLGGDSCAKPSLSSTAVTGQPLAEPDAPQRTPATECLCLPPDGDSLEDESRDGLEKCGGRRSALDERRHLGGDRGLYGARQGGQRWAALGACSAGRRLRAPLLTERSERKLGALPAAPPAADPLDHSLAGFLVRKPGDLRSSSHKRGYQSSKRQRGAAAGEMCAAGRRWGRRQRALLWAVLLAAWEAAWGQLRYSVPEEMPKGSFVGDVAKDLGLQLTEIRDRGVHILDKGRTQYFALHGKTGHLVTAERIDREQLCERVQQCVLRCELIVEGEMQVYGIQVEITDINDNAPSFREAETELRMSEMTAPGSRFALAEAHDPDSGRNSLQSYELSGDEHFSLAVQADPGGDQRPELVLAKAVDREEAAFHELVLRASDGGDPARTGTARIRVTVLDANDNAPVFSQAEYTVRVPEDVPVGSVLVTVTATDADEGPNGHVKYLLKKITGKASQIFQLDAEIGAVTLLGSLDYEEGNSYELEVQAHDGGALSDTAKVIVTVTDVNDNAPVLTVSSALSEISEDAPSGTVVALLHVEDHDSGANGEVRCSLDGDAPFRLEKSYEDYYRVVTARELDREQVSEYNVTVRAADGGSPALQSSAVLALRVLDVNDNAPVFLEERYSARLAENNAAGALVLTVRATDADWGQNARVRYRLAEGRVRGAPLSSYVSVQAETGALYALRSLDYEQLRELQLCVRAEDGGAPALSSNVSVRLLIVDENDNAPQVLYPAPAAAAGSGAAAAWSGVELAPRWAEAGALVAKVVAVDADAGQNAWLSYELAKATEPGLFRVGLHSGEVRTARSPLARDAARHVLLVLVRDHGRPALSATATLSVVLAESVAELLAELGSAAHEAAAPGEPAASLTPWLVLAVAAVSCLFVAFLLLLLALRLRRCHRQQLLPPDSGALRGVPVSHFVGIDGVRAFLQSYSHDVSLTADSRKSHLRFSAASCCDTLPARPPPDEPAPLLGDGDPAGALPSDPAPSSSGRAPGAGAGAEPRPKPGPVERGHAAAAVSRRRLRVSLLAGAERRWSRRRRSVLPPQAARSAGAGHSGSGTASSSSGGERRREAARGGERRRGELERLEGRQGSGSRQERGERSGQRMAVRQRRQRRGPGGGRALLAALLLLLLCVWCRAAGERLRYAIPEELGRGSLVGPLARDLGLSADELPARKLQVASAGKKQVKYFTVNEENGNLYVNERLDREEMCGESATCSVSFEALVQNPLNIFHVEVSIEDVNDNSPAFRKAALDLEIGEWTLPGARFPLETARDPDVGRNSLLTYHLTSNPSFSLALKESPDGSNQPELVLDRALDREKQSSFDLVLLAVDGGDPARSGTVQVHINVTDLNDNPPVFSKSLYEARVSENLPAGSVVLQVQATDADAGTNGQVSYSFGNVPDAISALFAVDRETGEVKTAGALDFEEKSKYIFSVEARDGGGLVSHCKVQIDVIDENDNAPEITILSLSSPVPEDAAVGTVVALLNVNDPDSGENGQVSCSLSGEAPLSIVASSGGSYKVVTSGALDREQASEQRVTVVARDRGRPALWSSRELVLEVSDVNDNAPVFEEAAYSAYVAENNAAGALVLRVQARDADAGANGRVSYWLAGGSAGAAGAAPLVSVEARSGALYAQRSLDYEQCREFTVAVRAQDGGSPARSSTATVLVFVLDRNDNAPRVLWPAAGPAAAGEGPGGAAAAAPFEVVPRSAEAGYLVAKVVAVDADAGRNAWLSYELVQASEPALFRVGLHSGEVRTARAVGERDAAKQRLVAVVKDHGQPALSATATLHVVLAESLQEALPELSERPAGAEAAAAAAELQFYLVLALALLSALLVLSVALAVLARLRRAGPPAVLRCLGAQRFSLAGAAFPADFCEGTLPYSYNLCVPPPARALPEAAWPPPPVPMLSAEELLGGDSCDKPSPSTDLVEGEPPANPDAPQNASAFLPMVIAWRMKAEMGWRNAEAGDRRWTKSAISVATVASGLDRRCCGAGGSAGEMCAAGRRWGRRQRALLWAVLLAAWEAAWGQLRYSVPEEMPKGSFVGDVAKDLGLQLKEISDRAVRIVSEGSTQYFALHGKTGHLVTAERIDREQLCERVQQCVLRCELIVEGQMQVYRIEVEITDINDNAPSFKESEVEERISETTAPGSRFPLARAHDPDSGRNSLQSYELSGDEHFSLAVQAGPGGDQRPELVLAKAVDREEAAFHELVLRASDGGDPARTGTARIRVTVVDANDNAPVFSQAEYTVRVPEDVPVGSVLVTVTATDADEGLYGEIEYSLKKEADTAVFHLDSESGAITLLQSLDFEEDDSYELELQARDGGQLLDTAKVAISVTDINDNAPEISVRSALREISEDAPSGTVVALLHVQDRDSGVNGEVRCSVDKDVPFRLEKSFEDYYRVVTARELDREQVSEYNVTVRAADGGSPALQSSAVLALRVLDVNDNAPVFLEERYSARLAENNAAGALVLTVRATDADWGQNARVRYRLAEGRVRGAPLSSYVSVQAETGALYALRSLDYEQLRELQLCVRAEDGGAPALSSNVSVRLLIVDENDNAPQVLYPAPAAAAGSGAAAAWSGVELAPRWAEAGALVAKVVAVDADAGQNAWLSYELAKATEPGLFRVGLHSGEVRTARSPLARDAARHVLLVLVRDHGRPALSATATLSVVLAESVAELLAELGSAAHEAAAPGEPAASLTRWLVLAVAAVSCLFVAFLLLLLALRLRRCHRQQLLPPDSGALRGVPVSHFVGIDGVRAFLQSYSHDVSLTADSRKSHLRFSAASCCDTLPARPPPDEPAPLLGDGDPAGALPSDSAPSSVYG
nr:uncharacterized protein LOC129126923 [Agelaius phoeniceus]